MSLPAIRQHFRTVDRAEVERVAAAFLPELAAVAAPQATLPSAVAVAPGDTWQRWSLLPGLEVHLHSSAGTEVRALAQRIAAQFGSGAQMVVR